MPGGAVRTAGVTLALLLWAASIGAQETPKEATAKPTLSIVLSLARQAIRDNDSVDVNAWVANESDRELTAIRLQVATPSFIKWRAGRCADWEQQDWQGPGDVEKDFGAMPAHSVASHSICLRSGSDIVVGDVNLLFTFTDRWWNAGTEQTSFVAVEKPIKVNLFGSESIAGIPMGLAGFVVPGLFFWLIVGLWRVPWLPWDRGQVALGDRLIYSLLTSMLIVIVGGRFQSTDISAGLGLAKLAYLAAAGLVAGGVTGAADFLIRMFLRGREQKRKAESESHLIKPTDDEQTLLAKLLETYPAARRPEAVVTLATGEVFKGSLGRQDSGATGLVGWFQVDLSGVAVDARGEIEGLLKARRWPEALNLARTSGLRIDVRETIQQIVDGDEQPQTHAHMTWKSSAVSSVAYSNDTSGMELISVS